MGVAVLNPQGCLQNTLPGQGLISPPFMKQSKNHNRNRSNRSPANRKKVTRNRNVSTSSRLQAAPMAKNLVMGQVKILKRGEELAPKGEEVEKVPDPELCSTDRLGPDPKLVPTQIHLAERKDKISGFYAGSGFFLSPHPSSLPMPAFFVKKDGDSVKKDATTNLRRLLGLDL